MISKTYINRTIFSELVSQTLSLRGNFHTPYIDDKCATKAIWRLRVRLVPPDPPKVRQAGNSLQSQACS